MANRNLALVHSATPNVRAARAPMTAAEVQTQLGGYVALIRQFRGALAVNPDDAGALACLNSSIAAANTLADVLGYDVVDPEWTEVR